MNRILLILLLVSIGIYLYIILFKSNINDTYENNIKSILKKHDFIDDNFIEKHHNTTESNNRHVHFSENNEELIFSNEIEPSELIKKSEKNHHIRNDNNYDNIFIDPIISNIKEVGYTNLTLSENEYFNNN